MAGLTLRMQASSPVLALTGLVAPPRLRDVVFGDWSSTAFEVRQITSLVPRPEAASVWIAGEEYNISYDLGHSLAARCGLFRTGLFSHIGIGSQRAAMQQARVAMFGNVWANPLVCRQTWAVIAKESRELVSLTTTRKSLQTCDKVWGRCTRVLRAAGYRPTNTTLSSGLASQIWRRQDARDARACGPVFVLSVQFTRESRTHRDVRIVTQLHRAVLVSGVPYPVLQCPDMRESYLSSWLSTAAERSWSADVLLAVPSRKVRNRLGLLLARRTGTYRALTAFGYRKRHGSVLLWMLRQTQTLPLSYRLLFGSVLTECTDGER